MAKSAQPDDQPDSGIGVLVVHSHPLLGSTIGLIFDVEPGMHVCEIVRTGHEAAEAAAHHLPAVVLLDFSLGDMDGSTAASLIQAASPGAAIVVLGGEDSETHLLDAIDAGAVGYLTRQATAAEIVEAVRRASSGDTIVPPRLLAKALARKRTTAAKQRELATWLSSVTPRERDILGLLAQGLDTRAMSARLSISSHTVEWHVRHLIEKFDVHSKLQLVLKAAALGMITV